jgi:phage N-6-adenine-methyltransferase
METTDKSNTAVPPLSPELVLDWFDLPLSELLPLYEPVVNRVGESEGKYFTETRVKESGGSYSTNATSEYKAISLWQPWASLISLGLKHYETRSWNTKYRGKLLICATASNSKERNEYLKIKDKLQLPPWETFTHGCALVLCDLVDSIEMTESFIGQQSQTEILCGDWQVGRFAWKLENIQLLAQPFAVKGKQGFFSVNVKNLQLLPPVNANSNFVETEKSKTPKFKSSDCWYTPLYIVELILKVLGVIDLDPCADDGKHIPATYHYTAADDGLTKEWHGRVFMNPPYSHPGKWMTKLKTEFEFGRVTEAIALVPAATDTSWLAPVLKVQPVCFWKGRIKFLDVNYQPKQSARQSHVLVYWGDNWKRFKEVFEEYAFVSVPGQFLEDYLCNQKSRRKTTDSINVEKVYLDIESVYSDITDKSEFLEESFLSSRKSRRNRGEGSGCIYYRTVIKKGKGVP